MARPFNDRSYRQPNFAFDGTIPELLQREWDRRALPEWTRNPPNFPAPPAGWPPLPSPPPSDGPSPFDQQRQPAQPRSQAPRPQDDAQRDAISRLLGMFAAPGRRDLRRSQSNEAVPGNDDLLFQRPWSLPAFDPCPDFPMRPRFDSNRSAAELQKLRPEDLLQLAGNKPARRRAVQPPILFGFD